MLPQESLPIDSPGLQARLHKYRIKVRKAHTQIRLTEWHPNWYAAWESAIDRFGVPCIGSVLPCDGPERKEGDSLLGILTERDYARKVALKSKVSETTRVSEIMTSRVFCATPYTTVDQAMTLASERNVRHLPVIDVRKDVIGVISTRDLIREKLAEQSFVIEQLEQYIAA